MDKKPMNLSEIDQEIERLQKLRIDAEKKAAEERLTKDHQEAVEVITRLLEDIRRLEQIGYLPPKLMAALQDGSGKFNPGMYIKRPRTKEQTPAF